MAISSAPLKLIDENGKPSIGVFDSPIPELNFLEFKPPPRHRRVSPNRIKRWEYLGLVSEELVVGAAVVSLHFFGNVFFYVFERKLSKLREFSFMAPLCRGLSFDSNGVAGTVSFHKGKNRVVMENDRAGARHRLAVEMGGLRVAAEFADRQPPLVCATRVGYFGFNYTLKLAGLPVSGELVLPDKKYQLDPANTFGVIDYTTGCLARETFWNWAAAGGKDESGERIGLNLVQGVNDTGVTENAFWVGERLVKVDTVSFDYDDRNILAPWRIHSWDGKVDLRFSPEGERFQNLDLWLMASRFHQPFGNFSGALIDDAGVKHTVRDLSGYTEEHFARW